MAARTNRKSEIRRRTLVRTRTRPGFTLIELLVVVAIIALLVAILLPSLQEARALAEAAVCGVNLKQIGTVWHLYVQNYDGSFFPGSGGADSWADALYLGGYVTTVGLAGDPDKPIGSPIPRTREGTFLCPSNPNYRCYDQYYIAAFNYTMNWYICFGGSVPYPPYKSFRLSEIPSPSTTVLTADSAERLDIPGNVYTMVFSPLDTKFYPDIVPYVGTYHNDAANILMVDCHVESVEESELFDYSEGLLSKWWVRFDPRTKHY